MPHTFRRWLARNFELISVVIMSLTAIATAWSGFQSPQWSEIQTTRHGEAAGDHTESVRASNDARQATSVDLAVVIAWLEARTDNELDSAEFIYQRFPERLRVAADAWLAEAPFENPDAPSSPFAMEEYLVASAQIGDDLAQTAEEHTIEAQEATKRANEYVLTTVLFATVLFFASISAKLIGVVNRWALLLVRHRRSRDRGGGAPRVPHRTGALGLSVPTLYRPNSWLTRPTSNATPCSTHGSCTAPPCA